MQRFYPHPATVQLMRFQAMAGWARMLRGFRSPRRLFLSIVAALLAMVWLGQVAAGLLLREPAAPEKLAVWIPLGLLAYSLWHVLKSACRTPIEPFEWTPAERELLAAAPLSRRELVTYRFLAIATAAVTKAGFFSLVMLPDLRVWLAGWIGMFVALLLVDLLRMGLEILVHGMSKGEFAGFRVAVLATAFTCLLIAVLNSLPLSTRGAEDGLPAAMAVPVQIGQSLMALRTTGVGWLVEAPFRLLGAVILTDSCNLAWAGNLLASVIMVLAMARFILGLDRFVRRRRVAAERRRFQQLRRGQTPGGRASSVTGNRPPRGVGRVPHRWGGAGTLAWRQAWGAFHYRTSVGIALLVPGLLSCMTLLTPQTGWIMLIQLVSGLVFYSFLLLPTALKFDFRRDIDRMAVLKALPASPLAVTAGQLAVPVALCTSFQLVVLLVALLIHPYHPALFLAALVLLLPINTFIFALENLIFLLFPYRLNQEGLGVFLRSILTFTAKSLLFAVGLAAALVWALVAKQLSLRVVPEFEQAGTTVVFVGGIWLLVTATAVVTTILLVGVYRRFDPSQDAPATS